MNASKQAAEISQRVNADLSHTSSFEPFITPMDLSFRSILCFQDIIAESQKFVSDPVKGLAKNKDGKWRCNAIRLNNNGISDFLHFEESLSKLFENFSSLAWLDVSFNDLHAIPRVIARCENLKVIYFHGNHIFNIFDVSRLVSLSKLISLTLHGNPVETQTGYRQFVLSLLPGLKTLDFSGVTKQDRSTAENWKKMHGKQFRLKNKLSLL